MGIPRKKEYWDDARGGGEFQNESASIPDVLCVGRNY